ncbi:MAG: hypothetical protein E2579_25345 [Pseudomonas sp.]|nr:hypothetical protein [Pseudomonas sp.]WJH59550.1 hypothetical protein FE254_05110 [Pseudomonas guguanensis]
MLSGVTLSCYQACETAANPVTARVLTLSNVSNNKYLTFSRKTLARWISAAGQQQKRFPRRSASRFPPRRAAP